MLIAINRLFARKGNYFKVDQTQRTLEICRLGRTVGSRDIKAVTLLVRWYRNAGGAWSKTRQTGLLVSAAGNGFELYPLVRELEENLSFKGKSTWADRLANIFQVPIRRVELSRWESRALDDC